VAEEKDILAVFEFVKKTFGTVHVLVNNAGVARPGQLICMYFFLSRYTGDIKYFFILSISSNFLLITDFSHLLLFCFLAQDPSFFREILNINVMGLTLCIQQGYKLMKESGIDDGHIFHINRYLCE